MGNASHRPYNTQQARRRRFYGHGISTIFDGKAGLMTGNDFEYDGNATPTNQGQETACRERTSETPQVSCVGSKSEYLSALIEVLTSSKSSGGISFEVETCCGADGEPIAITISQGAYTCLVSPHIDEDALMEGL